MVEIRYPLSVRLAWTSFDKKRFQPLSASLFYTKTTGSIAPNAKSASTESEC
ncbi:MULTISPECIES: hypothetical protein [unclassified Microcoleus]|uniref:hypothetical protein n=1 Tax=unclassified Microcoleus TaxID=2642155 RepID=UPI002FD15D5D